MKTIEIDSDVYRELYSLKFSGDDSFNSILRVLLGLEPENGNKKEFGENNRDPWIIDDIIFPHGTLFRGKHKGCIYLARVQNGALLLKGEKFLSPSAAVFSITRNPTLNGWLFWECKLSKNAAWIKILSLKNKK